MKKYLIIACMAAGVLCACNNETTHPRTTISNCNPDMSEIQSKSRRMAKVNMDNSEDDFVDLTYKHMLSVSCVDGSTMHIVCYVPSYTCCLTPHSDCSRDGNTITIKCWDTGLNPCNCNCPRKVETEMSDLPYGIYNFEVEYHDKLQMSASMNFTAETDTLLIERAGEYLLSEYELWRVYQSTASSISRTLENVCKQGVSEGEYECTYMLENEKIVLGETEDGWRITAPDDNKKMNIDITAEKTAEDDFTTGVTVSRGTLLNRKVYRLNGECKLAGESQNFVIKVKDLNVAWNHTQTTQNSAGKTTLIDHYYDEMYFDGGEITLTITLNGEEETLHFDLVKQHIKCRETGNQV